VIGGGGGESNGRVSAMDGGMARGGDGTSNGLVRVIDGPGRWR